MDYVDKTLTCKTCKKDWVWTADSQTFYVEHGFLKIPHVCHECRIHRILLENLEKENK